MILQTVMLHCLNLKVLSSDRTLLRWKNMGFKVFIKFFRNLSYLFLLQNYIVQLYNRYWKNKKTWQKKLYPVSSYSKTQHSCIKFSTINFLKNYLTPQNNFSQNLASHVGVDLGRGLGLPPGFHGHHPSMVLHHPGERRAHVPLSLVRAVTPFQLVTVPQPVSCMFCLLNCYKTKVAMLWKIILLILFSLNS